MDAETGVKIFLIVLTVGGIGAMALIEIWPRLSRYLLRWRSRREQKAAEKELKKFQYNLPPSEELAGDSDLLKAVILRFAELNGCVTPTSAILFLRLPEKNGVIQKINTAIEELREEGRLN